MSIILILPIDLKKLLSTEYSKLTYPGFLRLKELMSSINQMVSKQSNTYTYNGELYVSRLTNPEISKIQECLDTGVYSSAFEKLKYIYVDIGRMDF